MSASASPSSSGETSLSMMRRNRVVQGFFLLVLIGSGILFVRLFLPYATAVILAVILAAVFYPIYTWFEQLFRGKRSLAAGLMCILVLLVVVLPLAGFVGLMVKEIADFLSRLSNYVSVSDLRALLQNDGPLSDLLLWISERFGVNIDPLQVRTALIEGGKRAASAVASSSGALAKSAVGVFVQFFIMLLTLYYLFRDGRDLVKYLMDLSPLSDVQERQVMQRFRDVGSAVFYGNIAVAALQGVVGGIGFLLFGVPGAFLGGALIGLFALIPLLGGALVYVPAAAWLWWTGRPGMAIGFFAFSFVAGFLLDNVLRPKLLERRLKMHPLLVLFSIFGGMSAFGGLGILYGPLVMTVFLALIEIYKRDFRDPRMTAAAVSARAEGSSADTILG